jgi:hypothetical protein
MDAFIQRHEQDVIGVLHGFDWMRFRGTLRWLCCAEGLDRYLQTMRVPYREFGVFVQSLSERLKDHARELARRAGRPFEYLTRSSQEKEKVAQAIATRDGVTEGLVCVLSCVEPCQSFAIRRDGHGGFAFRPEPRKCMHLYFYYLDREFGLMHVRLATWLPFGLDVCLNGREYLARRMVQAGIGYEQRDNCFTRIDDLPRRVEISHAANERYLEASSRAVCSLVSCAGRTRRLEAARREEHAGRLSSPAGSPQSGRPAWLVRLRTRLGW